MAQLVALRPFVYPGLPRVVEPGVSFAVIDPKTVELLVAGGFAKISAPVQPQVVAPTPAPVPKVEKKEPPNAVRQP